MTVYEKDENQIVELLKMEGVVVGPAPTEAVLNDPKVLSRPQLFVIVSGDDWGMPENIGVTSQLVTVKGNVFIRSKDRRGKNGIFELYDHVVERLLGVTLDGAETPIVFDGLSFMFGLQNHWQYAATFTYEVRRITKIKKEL